MFQIRFLETGGFFFFLTIKIIFWGKFLTSCHPSFLVKGNHWCWLNGLSGPLLRENWTWIPFWWHCLETQACVVIGQPCDVMGILFSRPFTAYLTAVAKRKTKYNKQTKIPWRGWLKSNVVSKKWASYWIWMEELVKFIKCTVHIDFLGLCY